MTVLVTAMERSGLVKREGDPTDKRVALVALTPDGLDYLRDRRHAGNEAFAQLIEKLPADEAAALSAAIPALQHLRDLDNEEREPAGRASNPRRASDDIPSCLPGKPSRPVDSTRAQSATPTPLMDEHRPPAPTRFEVGDRVAAVAGIGMIRPRVSLNHERHTARAASSDAPSTVSVTSMFPLVAFE
jgi:hypothetical protein